MSPVTITETAARRTPKLARTLNLTPREKLVLNRAAYSTGLICLECGNAIATRPESFAKSNIIEDERVNYRCAECRADAAEAKRQSAVKWLPSLDWPNREPSTRSRSKTPFVQHASCASPNCMPKAGPGRSRVRGRYADPGSARARRISQRAAAVVSAVVHVRTHRRSCATTSRVGSAHERRSKRVTTSARRRASAHVVSVRGSLPGRP
jgi:hypothetical protein